MTKEEKNVFKDAKFGDKFLTRNGQVMIYQKQAREDVYCLFDEESDCVIEYCQNGDVIYEYAGNAEPQEDDIVKKYVQPSLPSNLDEAARYYEKHRGLALDSDNEECRKTFKAGAEWMAEQGETVVGTFQHLRGYPSVIELKTYLRDYEGEDVIVQIRKKEE